ncbi:MAG: hypothetical protein ABIW47_12595 [Ginsengibacter sp.]|jgi:hypothetical protein
MNEILNKFKDVTSKCCVTIILTTHRTKPDNEKDSILLKNLVKDAEKRLQADCGEDKEMANTIMDKLNKLAASIDHRYNLEGLVLFVNENIAEFVRLPLQVENRVVVDRTFHTRDLVRAINGQTSYYVLLLSRQSARMIEALSDIAVKEVEDGFPIENMTTTVAPGAASIANKVTSLSTEFFNVVDKKMNEILKAKPLPVIICTDESNYSEFLKVADRKNIILGNVKGNKMLEKAHHVVDSVWPVVKELQNVENKKRLLELDSAVDNSKFVTDFNDIWTALNEGRGRTLFVKQGYFQPARIVDNQIQLVAPNLADEVDVVDDIIDEMLDKNLKNGGDAVFMQEDELDKFQGLVLVTRY